MRLLHAGVDTTVIALWLGHEQAETIQIYLHADLTIKEQALSRTTPTTNINIIREFTLGHSPIRQQLSTTLKPGPRTPSKH
jgi:hypothetical protein